MPDHACARALEARIPRARQLTVLATLVGALLLAGCAAGRSAQQSVGGWFDRAFRTTTPQGASRVWYAAAERIKVYSEPDASSQVLGVLDRYEQIARYQSDSGFAYVETQGDLAGWVSESQLIAQPPRVHKPAAEAEPAQPAEATPAPPDAAETEAAPPGAGAPTEAVPPDSDAEPLEPERSVFDPY